MREGTGPVFFSDPNASGGLQQQPRRAAAVVVPPPRFSTDAGLNIDDDNFLARASSDSSSPGFYDRHPMSAEGSPYNMSPWNQTSPFAKSPWSSSATTTTTTSANNNNNNNNVVSVVPPKGGGGGGLSDENFPPNGLVGSLVREEGHIYSLAAYGELLYTGSDSKNIRVWKNQKEYSGFKSNSGLVKAIVISGEKIFTGHQDGKIRVWKVSSKNPTVHKRAGTLPTFKDFLKYSMNPSNYVEARRHRSSLWIKHFDAISCLSLNEDMGLLYSGSWDKTLKVWRISDSKCLESLSAHDDAVNSVVAGFDGLVFTGSADGSVKVWKREIQGKGTKHFFMQTLLKHEYAVTALVVNPSASVLYAGSSDGHVYFWEREKHLDTVATLKGHKLAVLCLAASGNLIFSGSADKTICVWRRDRGGHSCLSVLNGHTGPVKCLAVEEDRDSSPDDRRYMLYSGSLDKSVKVWKVAEMQFASPHNHAAQGAPDDAGSGVGQSFASRSSPSRVNSQQRF